MESMSNNPDYALASIKEELKRRNIKHTIDDNDLHLVLNFDSDSFEDTFITAKNVNREYVQNIFKNIIKDSEKRTDIFLMGDIDHVLLQGYINQEIDHLSQEIILKKPIPYPDADEFDFVITDDHLKKLQESIMRKRKPLK